MPNIDMKTLKIGSKTYNPVDTGARAEIGDLSDLDTTAKSNLVSAINEVAQGGGGGGGSSPEPYTSNPANLGASASPGSSDKYARGDHVHQKPTYSASDVGLGNVDNVKQYSSSNPPPYPVTSVNGNTGAVVLSIPSSASDVGAEPAVTEVTVSTAGAVTQALDPGKIYHFTGALTALTITLTAAGTGVVPHYHFDFDSGSTAPTVTIPNTVTMPSGFTVAASKHYEVDIFNGYGVSMAW